MSLVCCDHNNCNSTWCLFCCRNSNPKKNVLLSDQFVEGNPTEDTKKERSNDYTLLRSDYENKDYNCGL
jgi:hypothetical protein